MKNKTARILIVDDDDDIRANLQDILDDLGYEIETAADGDLALEKLGSSDDENDRSRNNGFDLCLLDFKMPGMNGAELFKRMREKCPSIQAIMITAYAGSDGVQKALEAGTWKVLRKPVNVQSLLQLISQAISEQQVSKL